MNLFLNSSPSSWPKPFSCSIPIPLLLESWSTNLKGVYTGSCSVCVSSVPLWVWSPSLTTRTSMRSHTLHRGTGWSVWSLWSLSCYSLWVPCLYFIPNWPKAGHWQNWSATTPPQVYWRTCWAASVCFSDCVPCGSAVMWAGTSGIWRLSAQHCVLWLLWVK